MKKMWLVLAGFVFVGGTAIAQAPAGAPAGSTGICKDGTYSTQATKQGACRGHKGIQTWYVADAGPASAKALVTKTSAPAQASGAAQAGSSQAMGAVPSGATGVCKDGTYSMQASKQGACRGHKGVQTWYAADAKAPTTGAATSAPMTAKAPAAAPASAPSAANKPATASSAPASSTPTSAYPASSAAAGTSAKPSGGKRAGPAANAAQKPQAPGGGPGLVWVNTESNVYHCNGDVFYGKTKAGAYMSEADAKAKGAHGERGKTCTGK